MGLIFKLYPMTSKTWLKDALPFTFWDRICARIRFYKFSFFIPSFLHQNSNRYYFVLATAKIPKIWKRTSLDVCFSICKSQDGAIHRQRIIQLKLIDCPSDTFFKFRNSPCTWFSSSSWTNGDPQWSEVNSTSTIAPRSMMNWWSLISLEANVQLVFYYCVHKILWWKDRIHCHSRGSSSMIVFFQEYRIFGKQGFCWQGRCHYKNEGKRVVALQNMSFIQFMQFFQLLHFENKLF